MSLVLAFGFSSRAQRLTLQEPNSIMSEWDYAANSLSRLCPAPVWDGWVFRDAVYDAESNTMLFLIQLKSLREDKPDLTGEEIKVETEKIIGYFKQGYQDLLNNESLYIDGDWMLYLSVGNLLEKLAKNGVNLQIVLLKPLKYNIIDFKEPMKVSPEELHSILK